MPQLDLVTFFTQFFWAVLSFFLFYFFVNKFILPELTRVLKYRSKASALSSSADIGTGSQAKQDNALTLSNTSGKSGSSTLYNYAGHNSARVLMQARQRKDTFLARVISGKAVDRKGFTNTTMSEQEGSQATPSEPLSGRKAKNKSQERDLFARDLKNTQRPRGSQRLESTDTFKAPKKKKKASRDSESGPGHKNPRDY